MRRGSRIRVRQKGSAVLPAALATLFIAMPALAHAADVDKGRATYRSACASCHAIDSDTTLFGPHLKGVVGRRAAAVEGYAYSEAMRVRAAQGGIWDDAALSAFLSSPSKAVPGTKMRFLGFWFQSQIDDVIAYLKANP